VREFAQTRIFKKVARTADRVGHFNAPQTKGKIAAARR